MTKKERAEFILKDLKRRYPETPVPLDHKDAYTLLVAVLLSAQCTDERVNKITPALFKKADTPHKMIKLKVSEIRDIIKPCGLSPKKSQAIYDLSHIIINNHDGKVPESFEELEKLPGVGHKTASVVMSQAFGHPAFPVDTHIHRLAQRWKLTDGSSVVKTERDLKKIFPKESWNDLHLQIIFYGRERCQARKCFGVTCPMCSTMFPKRKKPIETKKA
jgi:endonuclease-3